MDKFEKHVGEILEIIYLDRKHNITQRNIVVRSVENETVYATCLTTKAWRPFKINGILSWRPVNDRLRKIHQTLEDGYEKFTSVLSQIEVSEELEMELENIFNSQINEAVRLAYLTAMKRGFLLGMQLMDELRKKM